MPIPTPKKKKKNPIKGVLLNDLGNPSLIKVDRSQPTCTPLLFKAFINSFGVMFNDGLSLRISL